ncbi:hypothetical protein M8J76_015938 [Diaphorina citri]|nr:hypothetical protein M8J76_015938 [Diaphorina citri]
MGKDSLHSSSTHTMHTRHPCYIHTCVKDRSSRPCLRQRRLCSCKLRKQCSKFYSQLRLDLTASERERSRERDINVNDHVREIFLNTARQLQAGDPEKLRHLGAGDISDSASSRDSSEEEGGDMYTSPMKKTYRLYKKLVGQNYKMQKIILSKSS